MIPGTIGAMDYSTRAIMAAFGIARETVRNWSREFAQYLSKEATPGKGKHRAFSENDMRVFALVAELKRQGMSHEDIHATLQTGTRGELPEVASVVLARSESGRQIALLNDTIVQLKVERDTLAQALQESRYETEQQRGQVELLKEQLEQSQQRIMELYKQIARLEAGK